jgi:hypothetical protein
MPKYLVCGPRRVELSDRDDALIVDGVRKGVEKITGAILKALLRSHPSALARTEIGAILSGHHRAADAVSKVIWNVRRDLEVLGLPPIIDAKRGVGYLVADDWEVRDVIAGDNQVGEALDQLRQMCVEAQETVSRLAYVDSPSGVQYVAPYPGQATTNFTRFHEAAWRLLLSITVLPDATTPHILKLKQLLFELASYLAFWRMSTRHQEGEWKEEFRLEISAQMEMIENLAVTIIEGAQRARIRKIAAEAG